MGFIVLLGIALPPYEEVKAVTATGQVTATIVRAITITGQTPLDFGEMLSGSGRITVNPVRDRYTEGDVEVNPKIPYNPAEVTISGEPNMHYRIVLPTSLLFSARGNARALRVEGLQGYSITLENLGNRGKLGPNGEDTYLIGGTLIIPENTPPGHYRGEVPVTVTYE
jgi:spore coat protein U-like protein